MKNMKVAVKLIVGFLVVVVLTVVVGVTGIIGLNSLSNEAEHMYTDMGVPLGELGLASEYFQRIRVQLRNTVIYTGDKEQLQTIEADITDRMSNFETDMVAYGPTIVTDAGKELFSATMDEYNDVMKAGVITILEYAKSGMPQADLLVEMDTLSVAADNIANNLRELTQMRLGVMSDANDVTTELSAMLSIVVIVIIVIAVAFSLFLAFYLSGLISKPLVVLSAFMSKAGKTGDITLRPEDVKSIETYGARKDETGQTIAATASFINRVTEVSRVLGVVADSDLTAELTPLSEKDVIGVSLQKMTDNLNMIFTEINTSTTQVSTGSKQVADGAQSLAQGATEQAASIQELSSSIAEIAEKTKENAEMAEKAANLSGVIRGNAEKGSRQMDEMTEAVREINEASQNISRVIKVIDDIAFQTNILALNAAVEAARAGQHGKGFAVVAEEVRSLAAKSAEAAKETGGMIQNSMEKAELGSRIAEETAASLVEIVEGINESSKLVGDIARASEEQSAGIGQINIGIDQVALVVQQNSATAEESAAASEEMSGQSEMLEELVSQFKLRNMARWNASTGTPKQATKSSKKSAVSEDDKAAYADGGDLGKY